MSDSGTVSLVRAPPVFSLLPEILEAIFIHGARDYYQSHGGYATTSLPTWVNVSYVCRNWRNIALDCSILWTYHFNLSLRWTEEILLRSRQASLKFSCIDQYPTVSWWPDLLDNLLRHSERIQELSLSVPLPLLPEKLPLRAPRLETLEITLPEIPEVPLAIADADTPVLRNLRLSSCLLPWNSLNLSRLKILHIRNIYLPLSFNIVEFLAALGRMQDLTILQLDRVLPDSSVFLSSGALSHSRKIDLPRLALLGLTEPLPVVVSFLSCVEIPLKAQLRLALYLGRAISAEAYAAFFSLLAQRFREVIFRSLNMLFSNYLVAMTLSSTDCDFRKPIEDEELDCNTPLHIVVRSLAGGLGEAECSAQLQNFVANICRSLPLINVQSLFVRSGGLPYKPGFWKEILGELDGIQYMKLCGGHMPNLSMLSLTAHKAEESDGEPIRGQDSTLGHVFVPALEELELVHVRFSSDDHNGMSYKSLTDVLSSRKGLRECQITMIGCTQGL